VDPASKVKGSDFSNILLVKSHNGFAFLEQFSQDKNCD